MFVCISFPSAKLYVPTHVSNSYLPQCPPHLVSTFCLDDGCKANYPRQIWFQSAGSLYLGGRRRGPGGSDEKMTRPRPAWILFGGPSRAITSELIFGISNSRNAAWATDKYAHSWLKGGATNLVCSGWAAGNSPPLCRRETRREGQREKRRALHPLARGIMLPMSDAIDY